MSTLAWALLVTLDAAEGRSLHPPLLSPERLRAEALCIAEAIIGAGA